jgi:hypothetical protein
MVEVCIRELDPGEDLVHRRPEVGAVEEVILGADEGVLDGLSCCLFSDGTASARHASGESFRVAMSFVSASVKPTS